MRRLYVQLALASLAVALFTGAAHAQDSRLDLLQRQLGARDQVILELLQRVEALEKRVGVRRAATTTSDKKMVETVEKQSPAPGKITVTENMAERALERSLSRQGALLLRPGILEVEPSLNYSRRESATPSLVASGPGFVAGQSIRNVNRFAADLSLRLGLPWDSQLEIGLPYRWSQVETGTNVGFSPIARSNASAGGFGDFRIGVAKTFFREALWRPDLIGRLTWNTDSGQSSKNGVSLGGGFNEIQGSLTAIKRQDPIVFIGGLSYQYSFENNGIQPGGVIATNLGVAIALSPETSLRFSLNGAYQDEAELFGRRLTGSGRSIASLVIGGSTLLAPGTLLNFSLGMGLSADADDFSITVSLPIRFDSPLF